MYEIAWTVEVLKDPGFIAYTAMGRLWLEVGRNLADSLIIPFHVDDYASMLDVYVAHLNELLLTAGFNGTVTDYPTVIANLNDAVARFKTAAIAIQQLVTVANSGTPITLRQAQMLNNRLMQVERSFINEFGLYTEQATTRHVVFSKSLNDDYAGVTFSGILDPIAEWQHSVAANDQARAAHWAFTARYGISKLQYAIESAILVLNLDGY
jgi:N-acetylated-alpha-linked acidic dipeptidase